MEALIPTLAFKKSSDWLPCPRPFSPPCVSVSHSAVSDSLQHMDCSPPGSSVHGIVQARILERVAMSFSRGSSQPLGHQKRCPASRRIMASGVTSGLGLLSEDGELSMVVGFP